MIYTKDNILEIIFKCGQTKYKIRSFIDDTLLSLVTINTKGGEKSDPFAYSISAVLRSLNDGIYQVLHNPYKIVNDYNLY